jgi:hypothetical protein
VCIGLNHRNHAHEVGAAIPELPVVFLKAPHTVVGPNDDVLIPRGSAKTDWEVELAVVIGRTARYLDSPGQALDHVAGYAIWNRPMSTAARPCLPGPPPNLPLGGPPVWRMSSQPGNGRKTYLHPGAVIGGRRPSRRCSRPRQDRFPASGRGTGPEGGRFWSEACSLLARRTTTRLADLLGIRPGGLDQFGAPLTDRCQQVPPA